MTYYPSTDSNDQTFEAPSNALLPAADCADWNDSLIYIDSKSQSFYLNAGRLSHVRDSSKGKEVDPSRFAFAGWNGLMPLSLVTPPHGIQLLDGRSAPVNSEGYVVPPPLFNNLKGITMVAVHGNVALPDTAANNQDLLAVLRKGRTGSNDLSMTFTNGSGLGSLVSARESDGSYGTTVTNTPAQANNNYVLSFAALDFTTGTAATWNGRTIGTPTATALPFAPPMPDGFTADAENFQARLFCRPGNPNRQWKQLLRCLIIFPAYLDRTTGTGLELFDHAYAKLAELPSSGLGLT